MYVYVYIYIYTYIINTSNIYIYIYICTRPPPDSRAGFNRKAFAWNQPAMVGQDAGGAADAQRQARSQPAPSAGAGKEERAGGPTTRVYEVAAWTGVVRAEPDLASKMKTKKSRGAHFLCSEVTVNGWLKLAHEPGWILSDMHKYVCMYVM